MIHDDTITRIANGVCASQTGNFIVILDFSMPSLPVFSYPVASKNSGLPVESGVSPPLSYFSPPSGCFAGLPLDCCLFVVFSLNPFSTLTQVLCPHSHIKTCAALLMNRSKSQHLQLSDKQDDPQSDPHLFP